MKTCLNSFCGIEKKVSQKVKLSNLYLCGFAILALLTFTGCVFGPPCTKCMYSPYDNKLGWNDTNYFAGAVPLPNEVVKINAYNWEGNNWEEIGSTNSNDSKYGPPYGWSIWLPVAGKFWKPQLLPAPKCSIVQWTARVRAQTDKEGLLDTLKENATDCYKLHPNDWQSYCLTPDHEAHLQSYRDFGKECAAQINKIRAIEGKPPLQIDEAGECDADSDAKCNYDWELTNPQPHHCNHGAQNECDYKGSSSSIDEILVNCIWMWYNKPYLGNPGEKTCFQKNPLPNDTNNNMCAINAPTWPYYCYGSNCECGHYVNMINCPEYTHVSCGLYVTPGGRFKAVANFR